MLFGGLGCAATVSSVTVRFQVRFAYGVDDEMFRTDGVRLRSGFQDAGDESGTVTMMMMTDDSVWWCGRVAGVASAGRELYGCQSDSSDVRCGTMSDVDRTGMV